MSILKIARQRGGRSQCLISTARSATITASARTLQLLPSEPDVRSLPQLDFMQYQNCKAPSGLQPSTSASMNPFENLQNALSTHLAAHPPSSLSPTLPELFSLLRNYTSDSRHWSKYAHANASKQYTRNLVCEVPGLFNLLLLVWTPGKRSPVHDHADSHCLMKVRLELFFNSPPPY